MGPRESARVALYEPLLPSQATILQPDPELQEEQQAPKADAELLSSRHQERKQHEPGAVGYRCLACAACLALAGDLPFSLLCGTRGFSSNWRSVLGIGAGRYYFGDAGLDLVLVSAARFLFLSLSCGLQLLWRDAPALRANVHWLNLASWASPATITYLAAKCLARLIDGTGPRSYGMGSTWFWLAVVGTASVAVAQGALLKHAAGRITAQYELLRQQDADVESGASKGGAERAAAKPQYSATLADLASLTRPDWPIMAVAFTALLVAAGAQVLIPHYTGTMVAAVVDRGREADFRPAAVRLVGAAIVCAIFTGVRGGLFTLVGSRVNVRIRQMLFDSLVRQEIGFFDTTKTGEITSRLSADCTKVGDQVCLNINLFLRNFVQAAGTLLFMFYLSWRLSTVAFVSVPAIVGVSRYYGHFIRDLAKQVQERLAEANAVAEEALGSMTTVRSFAAEGRESAAYGARLHDYYALAIREAAAYGAYASTAALLPQLVTVLVLFYGGRMVLAGQLDGGSVVAFMLYLSSLSDGFNNMGAIFSSITQAVGAADKVFELIRREPQVRKPRGGAALRPLECAGELTLEEVHFTYPARPTRPVLHGVNLVVRPGQVLALVGPSGGGKSSCVSLIENFYHPDQGRLLLDGTPVQDLDHRWYHRVVSLVGQEPVLYGRTIEQNILYGLEGDADEPTHADVVAAARLANAHAFIDALPHGYDTQVGQRGVQMSGGQKQRIAIARALVRKPKVLLLDEATSALDAESEFLVQEAINKMMHTGMTVVIIAHRLSTIKSADVIAVVRAGRVVEQGSHSALLAAGGVYAGLVARQLGDVIE